MKRITIKDIAQIAGVSRGTVDRVINKRGKVARDVEARVLKIARDLGYEKNLMASQLARNTSHTIAVVCPNPKKDTFWMQPRNGILTALNYFKHYGIKANFFDFDQFSDNDFSIQFRNALASQPDAILLAPTLVKETYEALQQEHSPKIPIITINTEMEHKSFLCFIGQDSFGSGYLAGRLMSYQMKSKDEILILSLGSQMTNSSHYIDKAKGVKAFFSEHNLKVNVHQYEFNDFMNARKLSNFYKDIIKQHPKISCIFFTNSRAYKLLEASPEASKKFIVGYDLLEQNMKLLKEDKIDVIINQNSFQQGYFGIVNFLNYVLLKEKIPKTQYLPIDIVIKENVTYYENSIQYFLNFQGAKNGFVKL